MAALMVGLLFGEFSVDDWCACLMIGLRFSKIGFEFPVFGLRFLKSGSDFSKYGLKFPENGRCFPNNHVDVYVV